ncbi:SUKH-3 domain-containing protein [Actinoallomurus sp. CA-142502]|uniref:SUKH-3 domain-containing protein n=1 Tax=Actinoallomurus sp. CA-142502 TaxID=3239885 RepID=UPI003D8EB7A1
MSGEPPVEPTGPQIIRGLRFARPINGFDGDRPLPWQPRPWIEDAAERDQILGYLLGGAVVHDPDTFTRDLFDRSRPPLVPLSFHTDGTWIWSGITTYHLSENRLAPEPDFLAHIVAHRYRCPVVDEDVRETAKAAFQDWLDLRRRRQREREEYEREQEKNRLREQTPFTLVRGDLSNEPPTVHLDEDQFDAMLEGRYHRFSQRVEDHLVADGWMPGRDAAARVDPWLEAFCAQRVAGRHHEVFPAARAVLHEFGLLDIDLFGVTEDGEVMRPLHFYPMDVRIDPWIFTRISHRLGMRMFPIAQTINEYHWLVMDEAGRVYRHHEEHGWQLLGDDIDATLELLIHGRSPTPLRF